MTSWPMRGINDAPPGITGPNLHHTHKTGGIFVFFSFPIPNKLHFDAAKTIDVKFLRLWGPPTMADCGPRITGF